MIEKPIKIGVFTSNTTMLEHIKKLAAADEEILIFIAQQGLDEAVPVGKKMEKDGVEVILARRGTAHLLRENLQIPVLAFPQSDLNLILRLKEASALGKKILFPIFRNKLDQFDELFSTLNINVVQKVYKDTTSLEEIISKAKSQNFDVVVGGPVTINFAKDHGLKSVEIQSSLQTIATTIEDAKSVAKSNRFEQENTYKYQTIINSTSDGVIAVDKNGNITTMNSKSLDLLGIDVQQTIGKSISSIVRNSPIIKSIKDKRIINNSIETINERDFLFSHIPIVIDDQVVGGVSTFTDVGNVIRAENKIRKRLSKGLVANYRIDDLIHNSITMKEIVSKTVRFAKTNSTILISGETGTGKEILAQSIHNLSKRANMPFVSINCAAIPEQLLESELFGYEEGAFTGSRKGGKPGLFELAHTGTIFLDEISAAPQSVQTRLLRVLQEREVMRIGSDQLISIDVRVIAAANKDLAAEVRNHSFRDDLFFRLNVLKINLPPLRQRVEDIPFLADRFIEQISKEHDFQPIKIDNILMLKLFNYSWPGNIRQLRNFIERVVLLCESKFDQKIFDELYSELLEYQGNTKSDLIQYNNQTLSTDTNNEFKQQRQTHEKIMIKKVMQEANFNRNEAAKVLGISRTTLWRKMRELGID